MSRSRVSFRQSYTITRMYSCRWAPSLVSLMAAGELPQAGLNVARANDVLY